MKLYHNICAEEKHGMYSIGFGTTNSFKHPLGVLEHILQWVKGNYFSFV